MSFWAISPMYIGAQMQKLPPDIPSNVRPTISIARFDGQMTRAHPTVNGITNKSIVSFRPNMLIIVPMNRHIIAAPKVVDEPTQDHASSLIAKGYSLSKPVSFLSTTSISVGDVHPKRVPAARAPPVATNI